MGKPVTKYDFDANFNKAKVIALSEKIRKYITDKHGVSTNIWAIQPWQVDFQIITSQSDLSDIVSGVYAIEEVVHVSLDVQGSRAILLHVILSEDWYVEEDKGSKKHGRRAHPEAEGGALA